MNKSMQFRDLKKQYQVLKDEIDFSIKEVIENCDFIMGNQVAELEKELADFVGVKHCITCGNGTDALSMMMMAWDAKEGDAVFVPDFTFFASAEVVAFEGATPIFYDVSEKTFNADIESLNMAIKAVQDEGKLNLKAIIAVDLFGQPAEYKELESIAEKHNMYLLEDGAQGFGGEINGRKACSFGDAATTSFFPAKPLGCYGDGGAIFTNDDKIANYLKSIRIHGKGSYKYDNVRIGWNSRLDTLQAAILKVKLKAFYENELNSINSIAAKYSEKLEEFLVVPEVLEGYYSSWAQYTVKLADTDTRDRLQEYLKGNDIPTMIYYPKAMHSQTAFKENKQYVDCVNTNKICGTVLSIPIHPYMSESDQNMVIRSIELFFEGQK